MRILELELKNFGKFTAQTYKSGDGIWLFYGENESGKSTIHTFIKAMLFGLERGRGRASVNDTFSKYEPWENGNYYSGVLRFECGGKIFRLERNFDKYSKKAVLVCEDDGEQLSVEDGDLTMLLSGLTAADYTDTLYVGQLLSKTSQGLLAELKNYATNYYVSGDSEIDLSGALELLKKKRKEEENKGRSMEQEKLKERERIEQEASYVWRDVHQLEDDVETLNAKIEEGEERLDADVDRQSDQKSKWRVHPIGIVGMLFLIASAFIGIPKPWNYLVGIILILSGVIYAWNRLKDGKRPKELSAEAKKISDSVEKLLWERDHLSTEWKEKTVQYENLKEQLQELGGMDVQALEIQKKIRAYDLAMERMEEVSSDMRHQLSSRLNDRTSEILSKITGGRYSRLLVDEKLHMSVLKDGRRTDMELVSQGTLEQIYFALRMAAADFLHEEEYPIILDETFAFYDEKRLRRVLKWLSENKRQVIIFTCQKREEEILKEEGIPFQKTKVE